MALRRRDSEVEWLGRLSVGFWVQWGHIFGIHDKRSPLSIAVVSIPGWGWYGGATLVATNTEEDYGNWELSISQTYPLKECKRRALEPLIQPALTSHLESDNITLFDNGRQQDRRSTCPYHGCIRRVSSRDCRSLLLDANSTQNRSRMRKKAGFKRSKSGSYILFLKGKGRRIGRRAEDIVWRLENIVSQSGHGISGRHRANIQRDQRATQRTCWYTRQQCRLWKADRGCLVSCMPVWTHWQNLIQRFIRDIPLEEFEYTLNVNLRASFLLVKGCVEGMKAQKWGRIIFVSSIAAYGAGINGCRTTYWLLFGDIPYWLRRQTMPHLKVDSPQWWRTSQAVYLLTTSASMM